MNGRPKIKIELTSLDKLVELLSLVILIALWVGTIAGFSYLPDQVPSHFNALGQADDYSDKMNIFTLPVVATILYAGMTLINKYPHIYNYGTTITAENATRLYTSATRLISILKLAVVTVFASIAFLTFKTASGTSEGLGDWFLPAVVVLFVLPVVYYLKSSYSK